MKKTISLLLTVVMLVSMAPAVFASESTTKAVPVSTYSDVTEDDWYAYAVENLAANGIQIGRSDELFSADDLLTESEIVTYLAQLGDTQGMEASPENSSDRAQAPNSASSNDSTPATRQQTIYDLYTFAEGNGKNTTFNTYLSNYPDGGEIDSYAVDAMNWGVSAGIVNEPQLSPDDSVSRADFAVLLNRYLRNVHKSSPNEDYSDDYGIRMEVPSAAQQTIEPGCDFYIIGDFIAGVTIPADAHVEVKITKTDGSATPRILYCDKKNDYQNLYVDYQYLNVWSDNGDREEFRKAGMPDLVYDRNNPETFKNTWIKCFYSDKRFSATVYGGEFNRDVNPKDQFGNTLKVLDTGDYYIDVNVTSHDGKYIFAYAHENLTIGTYPNKIVSPFEPEYHFDAIKAECKKTGYEIFLDPFPGYWNCSFINPEWGEDYYGTITAKWHYMDATEYNSGNIHFYIYNVGLKSTSYNLEISHMEAMDGNLNRLSNYYYSMGEPTLHNGAIKSTFVQMDTARSPIAYSRVDFLDTSLGDNILDMQTLATVRTERCKDTVTCKTGEILAFYGVCKPIMSYGKLIPNDKYVYFPNNEIATVTYALTVAGTGKTTTVTKKVGLDRLNPPEPLEAAHSIFEFKHDFPIPEEWAGQTIKMMYNVYDTYGNLVASGIKGPSIVVQA